MNIEPIKLLRGTHQDTAQTGSGCVMNVVAYLNGEPVITDQSPCVCVTVRPIAIFLNDLADDEQRQRMLPLVMRMMGSRTDNGAEISRRLALLVEFANWQAGLAAKYDANYAAEYAAKSANYAAKSAEDAANAANFAKYAAEYAAKSANYAANFAKYAAEYAANSAKYAANSAKYAAKSANYAAKSANYAANSAEYAEYKTVTFDRGLALLDAMLPPAVDPAPEVVQRAKTLVKLNTVAA